MHSSSMAGGVMTMQREDRVTVPAGGRTTFGPGAYHLMLIGLTRTLKAGDQAPATLSFASGARLKVAFGGRRRWAPPAPMAGHEPLKGYAPVSDQNVTPVTPSARGMVAHTQPFESRSDEDLWFSAPRRPPSSPPPRSWRMRKIPRA